METSFVGNDVNINQKKTPTLASRKKFLVVEDDITIQPLWERIISSIDPDALIRWSTSEEGAEKLIQDRLRDKDPFDFIIADIMLAGKKNGIDLWKQFGKGPSLFLFASSLSEKKFQSLIGEDGDSYHFLVRKPLSTLECVECLKAMLAYKKVFSGKNA